MKNNYSFQNFDTKLDKSPGFMDLYEWETFNVSYWRHWFSTNWTLSLVFTFVYASFIFLGRSWMAQRSAFRLRGPLILWNLSLAIFSFMAFTRSFPEFWNTLKQPGGFHNSICSQTELTYAFAYWTLLGTLSKVAELGDTAFIVLRKQPLIFLHWYHHATVMIYTWFSYDVLDPCHRWFMTMNFFIHAWMYTYYFMKAFGVKLPRKLAMSITVMQLAQMIVGVVVNIYSLYAIKHNLGCDRRTKNIYWALSMYGTYFILFANFFYQAYFNKGAKAKRN